MGESGLNESDHRVSWFCKVLEGKKRKAHSGVCPGHSEIRVKHRAPNVLGELLDFSVSAEFTGHPVVQQWRELVKPAPAVGSHASQTSQTSQTGVPSSPARKNTSPGGGDARL